MFDLDLHFKFLRKATEAFFEFGQASVAATTAWQSHVHAQLSGLQPVTTFSPWPTWFGAWHSALQPMYAMPLRQNEFAPAWWVPPAAATTAAAWWVPPAAPTTAAAWWVPPNWPTTAAAWWQQPANVNWAMSSFMPAAAMVPWGFYQAPMISMMVSNGVPYAVAAPSARASTSAMDAAGAAYTQWRLIFGNDEKPIDRERARARRRAAGS